jgi:hypothetical protein
VLYSAIIASSRLGSLSAAHAKDEISEYLLTEACRLSLSRGGTCMPKVLHVQCIGGGTGDGEGGGKGGGKDGEEDAQEGGSEGGHGEGAAGGIT